jgi:hypothetical protein
MKTPREILLNRHQSAESRLDLIRRNVVADLQRQETENRETTKFAAVALKFWRELLWPCPRAWAGLAAVWLTILAMNLATRDATPRHFARQSPPSPQMRELLRQQQQLFAELVGAVEYREADRPKATAPQPRSSRREEFLNA